MSPISVAIRPTMETAGGWNKDTWTGIAGALVLVAAMTGVFLYERGQFQEYDVTWEATEAGSESASGAALAEGASRTHTFPVEADDLALARVSVALTWTDDVAPADTLRLTVEGPDDLAGGPATGSSSPQAVSVDVNPEPGTATATGRSVEDAEAQVRADAGSDLGSGEWRAVVTVVSAPGGTLPVDDPDGSQDYALTFAWDVWEPTLAR